MADGTKLMAPMGTAWFDRGASRGVFCCAESPDFPAHLSDRTQVCSGHPGFPPANLAVSQPILIPRRRPIHRGSRPRANPEPNSIALAHAAEWRQEDPYPRPDPLHGVAMRLRFGRTLTQMPANFRAIVRIAGQILGKVLCFGRSHRSAQVIVPCPRERVRRPCVSIMAAAFGGMGWGKIARRPSSRSERGLARTAYSSHS
jgi:hypothetical protein